MLTRVYNVHGQLMLLTLSAWVYLVYFIFKRENVVQKIGDMTTSRMFYVFYMVLYLCSSAR